MPETVCINESLSTVVRLYSKEVLHSTGRRRTISFQWRIHAGGGGGATGAPPLKFDQICFLIQLFFSSEGLKIKAQIARESIKTTLA